MNGNDRSLHFAAHGNLSTAGQALSRLVLSQVTIKPGPDAFVTAAQWTVAYDVITDFMTDCLAKLKAGQTPVQVPSNTRHVVAQGSRFSNPVFWAPFILVGDG